MILQEKEGIQWLEFELLKQYSQIVHGVFLRKEGVSQKKSLTSLNVGGDSCDLQNNIKINRQSIRECLGVKSLVTGDQRHEDHILEVDQVSDADDIFIEESSDGLFTKLKNIGLATYHADCQTGLFYDPKKEVIANVHCGWKGNVKNIFGNAVMRLQEKLGCDPKDLLVCISPSLGPSHAEFINYERELPKEFYPYQIAPTYFDLWEISYQQLRAAGVRSDHIEMARICTYENKEQFFSYRRERPTGRNVTVIGFKEGL